MGNRVLKQRWLKGPKAALGAYLLCKGRGTGFFKSSLKAVDGRVSLLILLKKEAEAVAAWMVTMINLSYICWGQYAWGSIPVLQISEQDCTRHVSESRK